MRRFTYEMTRPGYYCTSFTLVGLHVPREDVTPADTKLGEVVDANMLLNIVANGNEVLLVPVRAAERPDHGMGPSQPMEESLLNMAEDEGNNYGAVCDKRGFDDGGPCLLQAGHEGPCIPRRSSGFMGMANDGGSGNDNGPRQEEPSALCPDHGAGPCACVPDLPPQLCGEPVSMHERDSSGDKPCVLQKGHKGDCAAQVVPWNEWVGAVGGKVMTSHDEKEEENPLDVWRAPLPPEDAVPPLPSRNRVKDWCCFTDADGNEVRLTSTVDRRTAFLLSKDRFSSDPMEPRTPYLNVEQAHVLARALLRFADGGPQQRPIYCAHLDEVPTLSLEPHGTADALTSEEVVAMWDELKRQHLEAPSRLPRCVGRTARLGSFGDDRCKRHEGHKGFCR